MTTLRKNLFKQPFFWTSVCSFFALGILIGLYSYAWVSPTANPNSNAGSAINFSGGNVGVGTVSPSSKLDVVGNIGIRAGNGLRLYNPANADYATVSLDGVNVVQANYPWSFSGSIGIGATPSEKLEVAGNIKMTGTGNGIKFPDGTSQTTAATGGMAPAYTKTWSSYKHYFVSNSNYTGNLGGLSGCNDKCNVDANKLAGKTYHCIASGESIFGTNDYVLYNATYGSKPDKIDCWGSACLLSWTSSHPSQDSIKGLSMTLSGTTDFDTYNPTNPSRNYKVGTTGSSIMATNNMSYCSAWMSTGGTSLTGDISVGSTVGSIGFGNSTMACSTGKKILCIEN